MVDTKTIIIMNEKKEKMISGINAINNLVSN